MPTCQGKKLVSNENGRFVLMLVKRILSPIPQELLHLRRGIRVSTSIAAKEVASWGSSARLNSNTGARALAPPRTSASTATTSQLSSLNTHDATPRGLHT